MAPRLYSFKAISASAVISKQPCVLHEIVFNSGAATATVALYDDTTTSSPANQIGGTWTVPTGGVTNPFAIPLDIVTTKGLTIVIATAAANVTAVGSFSQ